MKGKTLLLTAIAGLAILVGCEKERDTITNAEIVEGEQLEMRYGETKQLHLKLTPHYVESLKEWTSSNSSVVSVTPLGNVTALAEGEATVTAITINDNYSASCRIVVTAIATEKIDIESLEIEEGSSKKLKTTVSPDTASYKNALTFKSTDATIAKVGEDGEVQAISVGKCQIEVTSPDGVKAVCNVEVKPVKVTDIKLLLSDEQGISLKKGTEHTIEINVIPSNATNKKLNWATSDATIATVDDKGKVKAVAVGVATITVKSDDNGAISKSFTVTVTE